MSKLSFTFSVKNLLQCAHMFPEAGAPGLSRAYAGEPRGIDADLGQGVESHCLLL
jgi:hypothetical protein